MPKKGSNTFAFVSAFGGLGLDYHPANILRQKPRKHFNPRLKSKMNLAIETLDTCQLRPKCSLQSPLNFLKQAQIGSLGRTEINSFIGLSTTFDLDSRIQNKLKEKCTHKLEREENQQERTRRRCK